MRSIKRMDGVKVLITGGLGFIGSNLAHKLVELGADVVLYDALLEGYGGNLANIKEIRNKVDVVIGDIRDYEKLRKYVEKAEVVYHCAAQVSRIVSMSNPKLDVDINILGVINVLEAAKRKQDDTRVIFTSSRAAIGIAKNLPANEETQANPVDIYGVNKLAAEMYCKIYYKVHGLKTTALR